MSGGTELARQFLLRFLRNLALTRFLFKRKLTPVIFSKDINGVMYYFMILSRNKKDKCMISQKESVTGVK